MRNIILLLMYLYSLNCVPMEIFCQKSFYFVKEKYAFE